MNFPTNYKNQEKPFVKEKQYPFHFDYSCFFNHKIKIDHVIFNFKSAVNLLVNIFNGLW